MAAEPTFRQLAHRMGMSTSQLADAVPWSAEDCQSYVEKHGNRSDVLGYQHLPDAQVAGAVRMLMRDDLDHESVVVAARDRICALASERDELRAFVCWVAGQASGQHADPWETLRHIESQARAALAKTGADNGR